MFNVKKECVEERMREEKRREARGREREREKRERERESLCGDVWMICGECE